MMTPAAFPAYYHSWIDAIGRGTGMPDKLLHVHAGMLILILARVVTRRSLATPIPFAFVCLAEAFNELMDRLYFGSWQWPDTSSDIANTIFWPLVLLIGLRMSKARSSARRR